MAGDADATVPAAAQRLLSIFVAGATGAIGRTLPPQLVAAGHAVTGMTRSADKADELRELGATTAVCDVFDTERLRAEVARARPNVVVNQLTDLPKRGLEPRKLAAYYARNDRVRSEGSANLVAAARAAGVQRYVGQSVAFLYAPGDGGVAGEDAPLWLDAPSPFREAVRALQASEEVALAADGLDAVVLRYGVFYGPNTWYSPDGDIGRQLRKRRYPLIGSGRGVTSFIHVDDAAAVERGRAGVYNVTDDEPAAASEWLPELARAIGAPPPRRVPRWLARLLAAKALVEWTTTSRGASNAKLKRDLGWSPAHRSWRQGFAEALDG